MRDDLDIPVPLMMPAEPGYRVRRSSDTMDADTVRLALIGGGIAAVLLVIGGAWKLSGHRPAEVPVVQADSRPLRSKPDNAGGMQVEGQNDAILSGATDGKDALAPPPEVPAPQALKDEAAQLLAARQAVAPPAAPPAAPASPLPVVAASAPTPARPAAIAAVPPARTAATPAVTQAAVPSALAGHAGVQLASLDSEALAFVEWRRLTQKMPDLLGRRQPLVQQADSHGRTYWRLRTGGFADIATATAFCQQVRAKGADCRLTRL
jgi:hypothetical protein